MIFMSASKIGQAAKTLWNRSKKKAILKNIQEMAEKYFSSALHFPGKNEI